LAQELTASVEQRTNVVKRGFMGTPERLLLDTRYGGKFPGYLTSYLIHHAAHVDNDKGVAMPMDSPSVGSGGIFCELDPVAPFCLGPIQGTVCTSQKCVNARVILGAGSYAKACRDGHGLVVAAYCQSFCCLAQILRHPHRAFVVSPGQHEGELFATVAAKEVVGAFVALYQCTKRTKNLVPQGVPPRVVKQLEAI
jgi:hypothetical protein